jgi:hypothetical protein
MERSASRWFRAALLLQILLLARWLSTEVVDLFPLNDLQARPWNYSPRYEIAVNALQLLGYMALFATGVRLLAALSLLGYVVYLGVEVWTWWVPYLTGASPEWLEWHEQNFSRTVTILPPLNGTPGPDLQHLMLQGITLITIIVSAVALAKMRKLT